MKRTLIVLLLILAPLALLAARPRPCRTRSECFYRFIFTVTPTPTATQVSTDTPVPLDFPVMRKLEMPTEIPLFDCGGYAAHACNLVLLSTPNFSIDTPPLSPTVSIPIPVYP